MEDMQIKLAIVWIAVMLTYLLGDVLRIFSGDYTAGELSGKVATKNMWLGIAMLMVIPVVMAVLTLMLRQPVNRWANIGVAGFFFLFNLIGLPTYPGAYDRFLIAVSLAFNLVTISLAWSWA